MAKQKAKDVKKEVQEQDEEFYGTGQIGTGEADPEETSDTEEALEKFIGEGDLGEDKPLDIAKDIDEDEKSR